MRLSALLPLAAVALNAARARAEEPTAAPPLESTTAGAPAPVPSGLDLAALPHDLSPWGMFLSADIVVKGVLIGLLIASVITWTVWLAKTIELALAKRRARGTLQRIDAARTLAEATASDDDRHAPAAALVHAAMLEVQLSPDSPADGVKERVAARLERIEAGARRRIARGTGVLATIGATAPFVGLFGTVWGIMNSFIGISQAHTTNLAVVAPGIAEALLATAFGLAAAIPAVVIYNLFARSIADYRALLADAAAAVLRLTSRALEGEAEPLRLRSAAE